MSAQSINLIAQMHPTLAAVLSRLSDADVERLLRRLVPSLPAELQVHPAVGQYYQAVASGAPFDSVNPADLQTAAEQLDQEYFRLQEAGDERWGDFFDQARLASAFALMAQKPTRANIADIIYEMAHAHDALEQFFDRVAEESEEARS